MSPPLYYRADIDGLRAVAVTAVILFHAFPSVLPGGFVGVDIFFVISGYLITAIILDEMQAGKFSTLTFYERRIRRIFPALIIVLIASLFVGLRALLPPELISLGKNVVASALFSANLMLLSEVSYFDIAAHLKPLLHLWSLGIEEQFYLAWPWIVWLVPRPWLPLVISLIAFTSFGLNVFLITDHPSATFFLPFTRAWELLAGAALVISRRPKGFINEAIAAAGVLFIAASFAIFDAKTAFPGWAASLPVIGTSLLILTEGSAVSRTLSFKPAVNIGLISYPLYLWHWPLLVFLEIYLFRPLTRGDRMIAIGATFLLSWLTYRFLERPIRRGRFVGPLVTGMACLAAAAALPALGYAPELPELIRNIVQLPGNGAGWRVHECMLVESDKNEFAPDCIDQKRPLIVVWGDSTASALIPGFRKLQETHDFGLAQLTASSCPPLLVQAHSISQFCLDKNTKIVKLIEAAKPDVVVLHAIWDVNDKIETTRPTIDALRASGVHRIVILGPVPVWPGGLPNATSTYYRRTRSLIPERTSLFVDQVSGDTTMRKISDALGVEYISARDVFCIKDECLTRIGNSLIASDILHLTKSGSEFLISSVAPKLGIE
jgi:peptidoglycan/LPS O-acetylase OafA/YrhL